MTKRESRKQGSNLPAMQRSQKTLAKSGATSMHIHYAEVAPSFL
ncbi:hypothetical protein [Porphyromonas pogonae]|nr:hypothetical protein [Porphyromonas pogonae]